MTDKGRPGRNSRRTVGQSGDPRDAVGDYVLGRDGKPLVDRYGRPVRRRPSASSSSAPAADATRQAPPQRTPRQQPPRQQPPPRAVQQPAPQAPQAGQPRRRPRRSQHEDQVVLNSQSHQHYPEDHGRSSQPRKRRPRRRRGPGCLGCLGGIIAILLVLTLVFVLWSDARLTRIDHAPEQPISDTAGTNWLLVGSDSREGLTDEEAEELGTGGDVGVGRTDTIMLLHIPTSGQAQLISIPRDSLVEVPGYGENKINAAFTFGGPKLLTSTVEQETGMSIDHYAEIGMGGLANLVNAVGGVNICVDEPIQDPLANLDVQAGCQDMDGATALGYVRTRATAQGDLDRVERQREFFASLLSEITSPATLLNPIRLVSLAYHGSDTFIVGQDDHVWHLARVALAMGSGVETLTVPFSGFMDTSVGNVVVWDEYAAEELFASMR